MCNKGKGTLQGCCEEWLSEFVKRLLQSSLGIVISSSPYVSINLNMVLHGPAAVASPRCVRNVDPLALP